MEYGRIFYPKKWGSICPGTEGSIYFGTEGSITIGTKGSISSAFPASCTNILYFTSLNDQTDTFSNHIEFYPNPFTSELTIHCPKGNSNINIINIHGKVVHSGTYSSNIIYINLDSVNSGLYMLSIEHEGIIYSYKIVKTIP